MEISQTSTSGGRSMGVCRCCLSHGPVESMLHVVFTNNRSGTYADMLRTCYSLDIIEIDKALQIDSKQVICDACISSLSDAYNFRMRVECSIATFREQLAFVDVHNSVKVEFATEDEEINCPQDLAVAFPIKTVIQSPGNDPLKETRGRNIQILMDKFRERENTILTRNEKLTEIDNTRKNSLINTTKKENNMTEEPKYNFDAIQNEVIKSTEVVLKKKEKIKNEKLKKNKNNRQDCEELISLKQNCTDYYFFQYFKSKYKCAICTESYAEVDDFKMHVRQHDTQAMESLFRYKRIWDLKLDISSMKCRHCGESATELDAFRSHLSLAHNVTSKDVFNRIMPYNLNKDEIRCVFCKEVFINVGNLNVHIKDHCDSNMCAHCNLFFPNLGRLKDHMKHNHLKLTFKCTHCDQSFDSVTKRDYHTALEHRKNAMQKRNICQYCSEKFTTHYQKILHLSRVHNKELKKYQCKSCPEKFVTSGTLSMHFRRVHLKERNSVCPVCGKAFFGGSSLTKHMVKHTAEKSHHCEVCNKSYARPYTLREHMKIHTNEKNHVCQICGRAFVAKCSLKYHMNVHKNEIISDDKK